MILLLLLLVIVKSLMLWVVIKVIEGSMIWASFLQTPIIWFITWCLLDSNCRWCFLMKTKFNWNELTSIWFDKVGVSTCFSRTLHMVLGLLDSFTNFISSMFLVFREKIYIIQIFTDHTGQSITYTKFYNSVKRKQI